MSWWSDLASKAEDLLNRVDQGAATALQTERTEPGTVGMQRFFGAGGGSTDDGWRPASERTTAGGPDALMTTTTTRQSTAALGQSQSSQSALPQRGDESSWYYGGPSHRLNPQQQARKAPQPTRQQSSPPPPPTTQPLASQLSRSVTSPTRLKKQDDEAALFDFLNRPETKEQSRPAKERPRSAMANKPSSSSSSHSRRSSASSTKSESIIDFSAFDETDSYSSKPAAAPNRNSSGNRSREDINTRENYEQQQQQQQQQQYQEVAPEFALSDEMGTSQADRNGESESLYAMLKNDFSRSEIKRSNSMSTTPVLPQEETATGIPHGGGESPSVMSGNDSPIFIVADATTERDPESSDFAPYADEDGYQSWETEVVTESTLVPSETPPPMADERLLQSSSSTLEETNRNVEAPPDIMTSSFQNPYADPEPSVQSEPESEPEERSPTPPPHPANDEETVALRQKVSSLELENKLLRSEVASLNTEIVSVVQREKATQHELALRDHQSEQLVQIHATIRELESRECDYMESLKAKDHQIGVLRVRLEEMDNELAGKNQAIGILENDRERILRDHSNSSGVQSQAMENMRSKLSETENSLRREQEAYRQIQREAMERQGKSDDDQRNLAEQLQVLHKKLLDEKNKNVEINNQLRSEKQTADVVRQELTDYKEKAARILQSKDKLIAGLRDGGATSPDNTTPSASSVTSELEEVKSERDMYKEELQVMSMTMERLRQEMTDLESQVQLDQLQVRDTISNLEAQLDSEKRKRDECDQEILKQKQELRYAHEEILQQRVTFQNQLTQKDGEVERISGQLSSKLTNNTSQAELENRLRALTESLIQKQTMLENISTEKTSLTLQLERMERRFRDNETLRTQTATAHVNLADDADVMRNRLPMFLNETTYDTHVTRGMKRAANSLDAFSIRLGVFLRRYPIARVFVILYMFMLHLWVTVVLLTYQPEIHGDDFNPKAPGVHHEH